MCMYDESNYTIKFELGMTLKDQSHIEFGI